MAQAASGRAGRLRERGSSGRDAGAAWRRWRHRGSCVMLRNAAIPFVPEAAHLELVIIGRATLAKHAARDIIIGRLAPGLIADLAFLDTPHIVGVAQPPGPRNSVQ